MNEITHKRGAPYGSADTAHVPAPDPELFWPFIKGECRTIVGSVPVVTFTVNDIHDTWIEGTEVLGTKNVDGELHLNRPVVIVKSKEGDPLVTLTLREIKDGVAQIQVTANPVLRQTPRTRK